MMLQGTKLCVGAVAVISLFRSGIWKALENYLFKLSAIEDTRIAVENKIQSK